MIRVIVLTAILWGSTCGSSQADSLGTAPPAEFHAVTYTTNTIPPLAAPPWYAGIWNEGIGAFLGAFFAFWSAKAVELTRDRFERQRRNLRALSRLQHVLNDYLGILWDNIYVVRKIKLNVEAGRTHWSCPRALPVDKSIYDDLLSLDVINELRSVYDTVRKINDDIENAIAGYEDIKNVYFTTIANGEPDVEFYKTNGAVMVKVFETGAHFHEDFMDNDVSDLLARARILSTKGGTLGIRLVVLGLKSPNVTNDEIEAEKERLRAEMKAVQTESQARIDRLFREGDPENPTSANPT